MKIHLTGDSLIARHEGYQVPILNHFLQENANKTLDITNSAKAGDNSFDLLARLDNDVLSTQKADKIFILIGTNDLASHKQIP